MRAQFGTRRGGPARPPRSTKRHHRRVSLSLRIQRIRTDLETKVVRKQNNDLNGRCAINFDFGRFELCRFEGG